MVENLIIDYLNNHEDIAFPARGDTPRGGDFCYYLVANRLHEPESYSYSADRHPVIWNE